jgi:hypothetical protein
MSDIKTGGPAMTPEIKKALDLALDALNSPAYGKELRELQDKAITAIRKARSAPVQEPYGYVSTHTNGLMHFNKTFQGVYTDTATEIVVVYTTPPAAQRQWVGLTEQEAAECWSTSTVRTWQAIEAKLREKNNSGPQHRESP